MSAGREIRDFVQSFLGGAAMADRWNRTEVLEQMPRKTPDGAWTAEHERIYKDKYGQPSGNQIYGGGRQRPGLLRRAVNSMSGRDANAPWSDTFGGGSSGGSGQGLPAGDGYSAGGQIAAEPLPDVSGDDILTFSRGGRVRSAVMRGGPAFRDNVRVPHLRGGGYPAAGPMSTPEQMTVVNPQQTATPISEPVTQAARILYDENGRPTEWGPSEPMELSTDRLPPMSEYQTADQVRNMRHAPAAVVNDRLPPIEEYANGTPRGGAAPLSTPPTAVVPGGASAAQPQERPPTAVTPAGKPPAQGAPAADGKRKRLNDQTRTEAFDENLDRDDPDNVLRNAINGGMMYANHVFHLKGDGVAVGEDPNKAKGQKAFIAGVGAAAPQDIAALDKVVDASSADKQRLQGPQGESIRGLRRLEVIYQSYVKAGQTDKANKVAFEIMQYSAQEASKLGAMAVEQLRNGDMQGAINTVARAYNTTIPDGRHMTISPDGRQAIITDKDGKVEQTLPFGPRELFNAATGFHNKSLYWEILANRAAMTPAMMNAQRLQRQERRDVARDELDKARLKNVQLRNRKLEGGGAGGGAPATSPLDRYIQRIEENRPATSNPPQGGGDEEVSNPPKSPAEATADPVEEEDVEDAEAGGSQGGAGRRSGRRQRVTPKAAFDPEGSGYDYEAAKAAGLGPDETGHWPSRDPKTGRILKGRKHETFQKSIDADAEKGYKHVKGSDGFYYSVKDDGATDDVANVRPQSIPGVPDEIIHDGRPIRSAPKVPAFPEQHPLAPYKGRNPFSLLLQGIDPETGKVDPALSAHLNSKAGVKDRQRLVAGKQQFDKDIVEWNKRKSTFEKEFIAAHRADQQNQLAETKRVYDRSMSSRDMDQFTSSVTQAMDEYTKEGAPKSALNDGTIDKADATDLALNIHTSNRNMPADKSLKLVAQLTRAGNEPGEEKLRAYKPVGRDIIGNVVVEMVDDPSTRIRLRPDAYARIDKLAAKRYAANVKAQATAKEDAAKPSFGKAVGQAVDLAKDIPGYLVSQPGNRLGSAITDVAGVANFPTRAGMALGAKLKSWDSGHVRRAIDNYEGVVLPQLGQ